MADILHHLRAVVLRQAKHGVCDPLGASHAAASDYALDCLAGGVDVGQEGQIKAVGQALRAFPAVHREVSEGLRHDH
jgi:hypothetical protein